MPEQRTIPFGRPLIGPQEKAAVAAVLDGPMLVHGPRAKQFEADFAAFCGGGSAVSVSSCTAALHLFYFSRGVGPGDEVIVPAQTHVATAHAVELTGARPVFVDAEPATGNIDPDQIEAAVTPCTKAISVVHFLGEPADMERINAIAAKHGLLVLEDCALSLGASRSGVHTGLLGDAGCFSFYPVKHMTTAEGGMLLTRHPDLARDVSLKRAFGVDRVVGERAVPGVYDVVALGLNYRMNEIQAALGQVQLTRVRGFLEAREANHHVLSEGLAGIDEIALFASQGPEVTPSRYCLSILLRDKVAARRFEIIGGLKARGVGTSVYYPKPVPHMRYYRDKYGFGPETFPVAARISSTCIALPVGPHLGADDMRYIVKALKETLLENV